MIGNHAQRESNYSGLNHFALQEVLDQSKHLDDGVLNQHDNHESFPLSLTGRENRNSGFKLNASNLFAFRVSERII